MMNKNMDQGTPFCKFSRDIPSTSEQCSWRTLAYFKLIGVSDEIKGSPNDSNAGLFFAHPYRNITPNGSGSFLNIVFVRDGKPRPRSEEVIVPRSA